MEQPISIMTDRCRLEPLHHSDKDAFLDLYLNKQVREFLGGTSSVEDSIIRFNKMLFEKNAINLSVRLKADQNFIGLINIDKHHDDVEYEVSYQFLPNYWGKGLAQETVKAAIEYGLSALSRKLILAETQTRNQQSAALLVKLGFKEIDRIMRFNEMQTIYEYRAKI
jgi:ribosomal-protein-alanine N-acetyltransferase